MGPIYNEEITMSNLNNIKKAISNTITATVSVITVTTEVVADASGLVASSISAAPKVGKAALCLPFDAATGYLVESEGIGEKAAHNRAYKYLDQDAATTIEQASVGSGKLLAKLLSDLNEDDNNANK